MCSRLDLWKCTSMFRLTLFSCDVEWCSKMLCVIGWSCLLYGSCDLCGMTLCDRCSWVWCNWSWFGYWSVSWLYWKYLVICCWKVFMILMRFWFCWLMNISHFDIEIQVGSFMICLISKSISFEDFVIYLWIGYFMNMSWFWFLRSVIISILNWEFKDFYEFWRKTYFSI